MSDQTTNAPAIFMFGMERSGTTLLSMMVGAHPEIAVPLATTGMWITFADKLASFGNLQTDKDIRRFIDDIMLHERIALWDSTLDSERIYGASRTGDYGSIIAAFHQEYARQKHKPIWANMDITTLDHMEKLAIWLPQARFVHIVRDGRDVALSHQTMPFGGGNIMECAIKWNNRISTNMRLGHLLGPDRYHLLRYEDIILEPETSLKSLCDFIGVPFDPSMLHYGEMVDSKVPKDRQWLWPELKQPPQPSKVYRWRQEMRSIQQAVFERAAGNLLRRLDYPEGAFRDASVVGTHLAELYYFLERGGRTKRFVQKLGLKNRSKLEREAKR
ncbi:MAG: sulfotransferase [Sphingomonadales bacterium]